MTSALGARGRGARPASPERAALLEQIAESIQDHMPGSGPPAADVRARVRATRSGPALEAQGCLHGAPE